jgi:hypothetical protein
MSKGVFSGLDAAGEGFGFKKAAQVDRPLRRAMLLNCGFAA